MTSPLQSLIDTGTKLYLDSVLPKEVDKNLAWGAVGATSNPAIISAIVDAGTVDETIENLIGAGHNDEAIAWEITDQLVRDAQTKFAPVHKKTKGNVGWVSFELDPLLEDPALGLSVQDQAKRYVELGKQWNAGHTNRMIKVPATPGGIAALEELAAAGVTLNVTLIFTTEQYRQAREAIWRGAQRRGDLANFKSVYSIFVSRIDVYTEKKLPSLSPEAQGNVGLVNAKRIWAENKAFWADKNLPLDQELIFASTGVKDPKLPAWKYVAALAGSDIQTNPPETNDAVASSGLTFTRQVDKMPPQVVQDEIDEALDIIDMHKVLMEEGVAKFVKPQRSFLKVVADKRKSLSATS